MDIHLASDLKLLLLGKTGEGKSSTGNILLNRNAFQVDIGCPLPQTESVTYNGKTLCVTEMPGLRGKSKVQDEQLSRMLRQVFQAVKHVDAVLCFVRHDRMFTPERMEIIYQLKRLMGPNVLSKNTVCVITHGDYFKARWKGSFEDWCGNQTGFLRQIFLECSYRCVLFDNMAKDISEKRNQTNLLLNEVNTIKCRLYAPVSRTSTTYYHDDDTPVSIDLSRLKSGKTVGKKSDDRKNQSGRGIHEFLSDDVSSTDYVEKTRQAASKVKENQRFFSNGSLHVQKQTEIKTLSTKTIDVINDLHLLLIGKSEAGKSATGNSIIDIKVFEESLDERTINDSPHQMIIRNKKMLNVTDIPCSLFTGNKENDKDIKEYSSLIRNSAFSERESYKAVILVIRWGTRLTEEPTKYYELLPQIFGENIIKDHTVCVVTHGDEFKRKSRKSFKLWCERESGILGDIFKECNYRCVLFDNGTENCGERWNQLIRLLNEIDKIQTDYTLERFRQAQKAYREIEVQKIQKTITLAKEIQDKLKT